MDANVWVVSLGHQVLFSAKSKELNFSHIQFHLTPQLW